MIPRKIPQCSAFNSAEFIKNWNFPNPDWSSLPKGFPKVSKKDLTREEKHLLDGIKLVWLATSNGKKILYQKATKISLISLMGLIVLLSLMTLSNQDKFSKPVSAATISATLKRMTEGVGNELNLEGIVESTMSAARFGQ